MKRIQNRKETVRRERMIMALSSVFVLGALVCVGVYMNGQTDVEQDNGYEIDFASLESNVDEKYAELTDSIQEQAGDLHNADDALDYMPREDVLEEGIYMEEAGSGKVEIGKLQKNIEKLADNIEKKQAFVEKTDIVEENQNTEDEILGMEEFTKILENQPAFLEASGLYMPVEGNVLMHYDMDHTVYFATLDQYKYNPATIIQAAEGTPVYACADATIVSIYSNEEIGNAICLDLGNGYEVTYGQVKDIAYKEGEQIERGTQIAVVAAPTKYYSLEGSNLYFAMKKDGEAKNAESLMPIDR